MTAEDRPALRAQAARPDPDRLLARVRRDADAATRGRLRIYFGASAGVGKTYAMLVAGRRLADDGVDVVVGVVATHGRRGTAALLGGDVPLETLPRTARRAQPASDEPVTFDAFDLDAALARKPALVLVDELAHTNGAGARHPKRWQDVDELLAAGIDVFTTLNVQHLESLNDVVGGITGIRVWETVPDTVFDRADEVILVDLPADELLQRLAAGKVYLPEQAAHAARNFFRKGNLIALREIALRRTADRVENDVQAYREERSIDRVWGTEAAFLCCIGPDAGAERVVRSAARLAGQVGSEWHAVHVETPRLRGRPDDERDRVLRVVRLASDLGASTAVLGGGDVADALVRYARERNLSRLVVGQPGRAGVRRLVARSLVETISARAPEVDLVVVGHAREQPAAPAPAPARSRGDEEADRADDPRQGPGAAVSYLSALVACAAVTGIALPAFAVLHPTNIAMVYLLAVTLIAVRLGRGPATFASFVAVAAFDFFFVPPRFSFAVADAQYLVTFCVMSVVALVIGTLAANLRHEARVAARREDQARALFEIARELSKALRGQDVIELARTALGELFDARVHVLLPVPAVVRRATGTTAAASNDHLVIDDAVLRAPDFEPAIAQWAFQHGAPAGAGTDTLPGSPWLCLPLRTSMRVRGVLVIRPAHPRQLMVPERRRLAETLAALVAIAVERVHYVEVAQEALLGVQAERLRSSILSALSHDLRTPLAAMAGLAQTLRLRRPGSRGPEEDVVSAMQTEIERMSMLVENLLDMARIESGDVKLNRQWHSIEETVGAALQTNRRFLAQRRIETAIPRDLPLVRFDAVLIERVLTNLLQNAAKHTPAGTTVRIAAEAADGAIELRVEDDGPGFPPHYDTPERIERLFDKFTRGADESARGGVGLGLAICRAIVEAHRGSIAASRIASGGMRFVVTLPREEAPTVEVDADVERDDVVHVDAPRSR